MAYGAADLYRAQLLPPPDSTPPANGTPLFNYIVARLTDSFDPADLARYLAWIQMSDHDTLIGGHGQHLKECHQVLAWGYDLDGPRLAIPISLGVTLVSSPGISSATAFG